MPVKENMYNFFWIRHDLSKRWFSIIIDLNSDCWHTEFCVQIFWYWDENMVSEFRLVNLPLHSFKPFLQKKVIDNVVSVYKNLFTYLRHTFSFPFDSWHEFFFCGKERFILFDTAFCLRQSFTTEHSQKNPCMIEDDMDF